MQTWLRGNRMLQQIDLPHENLSLREILDEQRGIAATDPECRERVARLLGLVGAAPSAAAGTMTLYRNDTNSGNNWVEFILVNTASSLFHEPLVKAK